MNTHAIKLDIDKRRAVLEPIVIAQGDKNGTTIQATIYDAGTLVTTQGLTARFRMRLPDGRHFYEKTAAWSYSTGTASVTIDETQAASVAGTTHECYFVLLNGSTVVHSTSRFAIRVLRDATDGIAATSYSDRLEDLLDELGDLPLPADTTPVMDGNAYKGSSTRYARQDHRHPTDTSRAPLASPALTGSPTAPTPAQSDDGTRIATTHWVRGMASTSSPVMDGSASYGSSAYYARADHRHPTDTTRAAASDLATHTSDATAHVTAAERSVWDAKASTDTATNVTNGLMSATDKVKLDGIDSGANAYSLPPATDSSLGGVIPDGTTITVDADGTIHGASTYELPTMSSTVKGGAILGRGLEIEDGVLSVSTEGDGAIRSVTAEGWAEQDGTPSPDYPQEIQVVRGHEVTGKTGRFVDLEVRDANDQLLSTIPIPLPSKGFAASLPDGTHDTLTIDGAGHVEWESASEEYVVSGTEGASASATANGTGFYRAAVAVLSQKPSRATGATGYCTHAKFLVSTTEASYHCWTVGNYFVPVSDDDTGTAIWQRYAGARVIYPLATPTTEDCGYIDLPITTEGDTVDIPELEDVAVVRWADAVATEVAQAWYRRASAVESRVAALEAAVAEIVANG